MTIDLMSDELLTLPQFCKLAGGVNLSTAHRWRMRGIRGIKLQCLRIGGKRFVTRRAAEEFIAAITHAVDGHALTPASVSKRRAAEIAAAEARCTAAGI